MTQPVGSAAIKGFLYRILHHLDCLTALRLRGKSDEDEVKDACLILEPRDGGDVQAHESGLYLVEQYKTRSTGETREKPSLSSTVVILKPSCTRQFVHTVRLAIGHEPPKH